MTLGDKEDLLKNFPSNYMSLFHKEPQEQLGRSLYLCELELPKN